MSCGRRCVGRDGDARSWCTGKESGRLEGLAVRACWDSGGVGNGGDGAERLVGLSVRLDNASRIGIDSREVLVVTIAAQENTVNVGGGGIVLAANAIENVLAVVCSIWLGGIASLEAEGSSTHKVVPFDGLNKVTGPGVGEEKGAERVTTLIGTVGVEFSSGISWVDVDKLLIDKASDLNVIRSLHELNTSDRTLRDDTGTVAWLCAPSDVFTFGVADEGVGFAGTPEAEIINAVDDSGLAQRVWALGSAIAQIVTSLGTALTVVGISLFRQGSPFEMLGSQRNG